MEYSFPHNQKRYTIQYPSHKIKSLDALWCINPPYVITKFSESPSLILSLVYFSLSLTARNPTTTKKKQQQQQDDDLRVS